MPLHEWSRVPSNLYHNFRQGWSCRIAAALNKSLPIQYTALLEPSGGLYKGVNTDNLTEDQFYAGRANRIAIKHELRRTVAVIEIVSPGNIATPVAFAEFVEKMLDHLRMGIHLLVIDPFPSHEWYPHGIHRAIWDEIETMEFELPPPRDRLLASYVAGREKVAYVEPVKVGQDLPDMPLFVTETEHFAVPLGPTYESEWDVTPATMRKVVETGILPTFDDDET